MPMTSYREIERIENETARAVDTAQVLQSMEDLVRSWYVKDKLGPETYEQLLNDIYATRLEVARFRDELARMRRGEK